MRTATFVTIAALLGASATLLPSASQASPPTVPLLNGKYVFQKVENCGGGVMVQITGTWTFDNAKKTYTATGYSISGVPLEISPVSGNGTYSNTATEVTFGSTSYDVFYGRLASNVAQDLVLIALGTGPCGEQFTMTH